MYTQVLKLALGSTVALSSVISALHYGCTAYVNAESALIDYSGTQLKALQGATLDYLSIPPDTKPQEPPTLQQLASDAAIAQGLKPELLFALIKVESNWNPEAVSSVGATGLTQVMKFWVGSKLCPSVTKYSQLFDPKLNLECGVSILISEMRQVKSVKRALISYNGGPACAANPKCLGQASQYADRVILELAELMVKPS